MSRRRRLLSKEERTLWETVARTAIPLRPETAPEPEETVPLPPPSAEPAGPAEGALSGAAAFSLPKRPKKHVPPPLQPIDRRTHSRVSRGTVGIDSRIDLHGLTQAEAHDRLHGFLRVSQQRGDRLVLVITGKGRSESEDVFGFNERGVLRRLVPRWLAEPAMRTVVVGFDEAHRAHGGGGALYVRIRKPKKGPGETEA